MKRNLLFLIVSLTFQLSVFSQYNKGKFYFDTNYRYNNKNQMSDGLGDQNINSALTSNFGYFVLQNFVVGVGINDNYSKSATTIRGIVGTANGVPFDYERFTNSSIINGFAPAVFVKYIYPFSTKFSISLMLRASTGSIKEDVSVQLVNKENGSLIYSTNNSKTGKYSDIVLSPEIRYSITNYIGLQINFNGYAISTFPKGNSMFDYSRYGGYVEKNPIIYEESKKINLYPTFWSFGVFVVL